MIPTHLSREFGRRLRQEREEIAFTQEEFAKLSRIPQYHLSKLESGHRLPDWKTLRKLVRALGAPAAERLLVLRGNP